MKKLFAIMIMCSLSMPVLAIDEQDYNTQVNEDSLEVIQPEDASALHQDATEQDTIIAPEETLPSRFKMPYSKKKLAKKFLIAMLCVAGCSVFLYGTLTVYNKVRNGLFSQAPIPPEGEKPLDAPSDITEAVKTFIDKTKWQG